MDHGDGNHHGGQFLGDQDHHEKMVHIVSQLCNCGCFCFTPMHVQMIEVEKSLTNVKLNHVLQTNLAPSHVM
jgi:hypothetical protein